MSQTGSISINREFVAYAKNAASYITQLEQKIRMLEQVQLMNDEDADSATTESLAREIEDMVAAPERPESEAAQRMLKHVARASKASKEAEGHPPSPEAPKAPSQCAAGLAALPPPCQVPEPESSLPETKVNSVTHRAQYMKLASRLRYGSAVSSESSRCGV